MSTTLMSLIATSIPPNWQAPALPKRGWYKLYVDHVQHAHLGADLDFLVGGSSAAVPRDSH